MSNDSHTAYEPHPTAAMDGQYREREGAYTDSADSGSRVGSYVTMHIHDRVCAERDRLRKALEDARYAMKAMRGPANAHEWREWAQGYIESMAENLDSTLQEVGDA